MVLLLGVIVWKVVKLKTMVLSTKVYFEWRSEIRFYELLGFDLIYTYISRDEYLKKDPSYVYTVEPDLATSFVFEGIVIILILASVSFLNG